MLHTHAVIRTKRLERASSVDVRTKQGVLSRYEKFLLRTNKIGEDQEVSKALGLMPRGGQWDFRITGHYKEKKNIFVVIDKKLQRTHFKDEILYFSFK